jgi:deoxycytidylate deaminase
LHLSQLKRIANRSSHHRYLHSALIYSGARLLSIGYNNEKHHAEVMAINRLQAIYRTDNSRFPNNLNLISFMQKRVSRSIGNSFPCPNCLSRIKKLGIRKVTFFNGETPCQVLI